jgi:hypothetical protein
MSTRTHTRLSLVRWAAAPTLLMAVLNVGAGPGTDPKDMPRALAWGATVLGLVGLIAAISLLRRVSWARTAVIVVGALNVAGGILGLVQGYDGAVVGVVLGLAALTLALVPDRS